MKKGLTIFLLVMLLITGCSCKKEENLVIPKKETANDTSVLTSPINTKNIDKYMFMENVQYVDLRSPTSIMKEGHVAGFEFIPFLSFIASFNEYDSLYRMKATTDSAGKNIPAGQIGGFVAQYEESERIVKSLFSKDKYIFLISQAGSESSYMINLLIQLGYDGNLLYNVGGVINSEGIPSYKSITTNKYFVNGCGDVKYTFNFGILDELTPIK